MNINLQDLAPDTLQYMVDERNAANISMKKNDVFINGRGKVFLVLEDSPVGEIYVKCQCEDKFGTYKGYRPKIVLVS